MTDGRIDTEALKRSVALEDVVGRYVKLRRNGSEYSGLCPFHEERSPSFTVNPGKGFYHCFGCGAHGDAIRFIQSITGQTFQEACSQLGERDYAPISPTACRVVDQPLDVVWVPLLPVPDGVPELLAGNGWTVPIWNPKSRKLRRMKPVRVDAYRNADGRLLGYVLRCEFEDRATGKLKKWTPQVTWCVGPEGQQQWCLVKFPTPRPLCGLDTLAAKPDAPVLIPEGEKCRAAGADAWAAYAVATWAGGGNAVGKSDWAALAGRNVVLWPDADAAGRKAMLGWRNDAGQYVPGVAQLAARAGAKSIRLIDVEGQPAGWDIADALQRDGWTPRQLAAWAANRVIELNVVATHG